METAITKLFGVKYPIFCAPMFLVSNVDMVVATSEAGGIGAFPALNYRPVEKYREAIREIRKRTSKSIAVNVIVQSSNKYREEHVNIAVEEGVDLLISSLGSPRDLIRRTQGTKTKVFCDVVGLEHAKKAADAGAHGLIAVGAGAGGHAGDTSLFALIPQLKKEIGIPIVAAGAISGGAGMAAALALGADGIYMGTRFIASKESPASEVYKQAIVSATPEKIVNTDRVDGFPGNFILTKELIDYGVNPGFFETLLRSSKKLNRYLVMYRAGRALLGSTNQKASYKTIFSAGHGVGLIHDIPSIGEIIARTIEEYEGVKGKLP